MMGSDNTLNGNVTIDYKNIRELPISSTNGDTKTSTQENHVQYSKECKWEGFGSSNSSVSAFDVAKYILKRLAAPCSTMKLHKLLYYSQAWSMVWEEKPLFYEPIEAWANGPVVRKLFNFHRGLYQMDYNDLTFGNESLLNETQKEDIDEVLKFYGNRSAQWLIDQSHSESPWIDARKGLASNERGNSVISLQSMQEYYSSLS